MNPPTKADADRLLRFLNRRAHVTSVPKDVVGDSLREPSSFVAWLISARDSMTRHQLGNAGSLLIRMVYSRNVAVDAAREFYVYMLGHSRREVRSRGMILLRGLKMMCKIDLTQSELAALEAARLAGVYGDAERLLVELVPGGFREP